MSALARRIVPGALIVIALLFFLFPVVWMVLTSFKTQAEYFANPPVFIPHSFDLTNYLNALPFPPDGRGGFQGLRDSLIISVSSTVASVVIGPLAAYSFARFRTGGENLSFWVLSTKMPPPGPRDARIRCEPASRRRPSRSVGLLTPNSAASSCSVPRRSPGRSPRVER